MLLVKIESTVHMTVTIGVPPSICQAVLIGSTGSTLDVCKEIFQDIKEMAEGFKDAVKKAVKRKRISVGRGLVKK